MDLNKPQQGDQNWHTPVNDNFEEIENEFNFLTLEGKRMFSAFRVIANDPENMAVRVLPGWVWNRASITEKDEQSSGNFATPDTNSRIDRIVLDDETGDIDVLTGAEGSSPSPPDIPYGKLPCAQIHLEPSTTSISDSDIVDERADFPNTQAKALHGVQVDEENRMFGFGQKLLFKTANFTLSASEQGHCLDCAKSSTFTITVPNNDNVPLPVGYTAVVVQAGSGTVTFSTQSGVTIRTNGSSATLHERWSSATIYKRATNEWVLVGDVVNES